MKKLIPLLLLALAACNTTVSKEEAASVEYGAKPTHWKEDIQSYMKLRLNNPKDAVVEFPGEPQKLYNRQTPVRDKQWGWGVCVWVKDKDKEGKDDLFPMTFVFRDDKIVNVNGGPDDANVIGARYSRDQCDRLGTPFIPLK